MKTKAIFIIMLLLPALLPAQGFVNNGASIVVEQGAYMEIDGNKGNYSNLNSGGNNGFIYLDGQITLTGSWYNNSDSTVFAAADSVGLVSFEHPARVVHEFSGNRCTTFENLTISSDNTAKITFGTEIRVMYDFVLNGTLEVNGKLYIEGGFENNGEITGTGTVYYQSTKPQMVAPGSYPSLVLDNPGGLIMEDSVYVENQLELSQGALILGEHNLVLGPNCIVVESKAPGAWVDATGAGMVIKLFDKTGTFEFPVGNFGSNPAYSPVEINLLSANFNNGQISVRLKPEVHPDNNTGTDFPNFLTRYWVVESQGLTNPLYDITFWYDQLDVIGSEDSIDGGKFKNDEFTHWLHYSRVNTDENSFTATGLTSFSVFSGVQGFRAPTITVNSPANNTKIYEYNINFTGTANDKDGDLEDVFVKLNDDNWQPATGTTTWNSALTLVPGINTIQVKANDNQDIESANTTIKVLLSIQEINIPQGWSYISSFLDPLNPDIVEMMSELVGSNSLSILTGTNGIYAPAPFFINTLNTFDVNLGYKVKMNMADKLVVRGDALDDGSLNFCSGTHLIPVLTNQTSPVYDVIENPQNNVLYMLDLYCNKIFWPNGGIFTLTDLEPGRGYLANFVNEVTMDFPPLSNFSLPEIKTSPPLPGPWPLVRTGNVHLISVSADAIADLKNVNYIGAFDSNGFCAGFVEINNASENVLLTVYGDDPLTNETDGMVEGETINLSAYNVFSIDVTPVMAEWNPAFNNADGQFYNNGLSQITGFKTSVTGIEKNEMSVAVLVYPNPAKNILNISCTGFNPEDEAWSGLKATLISAESKLIKSFNLTKKITKVDINDLQPGVYLLRLANNENVIVKRIVVQ
ncbi:MAG: T9SS type A sorting domain-containing protein [Bacteroidales bacterium]|nr:T9SS type A sorting domain-containing protein [Bacteroidales bacterium]